MGNATDYPVYNQSDSKEVQTDHSYLNTEEEEYLKAFDEVKSRANFFSIYFV
jgi:hypothetical protein